MTLQILAAVATLAFPERTFKITDFGAKPDGSKSTLAIAATIEACDKAGGGRVVVPTGTFFTGPVHLRSNIELHLEKGAKLWFTDEPKDYLPAVMSSWEGLECMNYSPLVYAYCCTNVAITGEGTLAAKMEGWARYFRETSSNIQEARRVLYTWGATDYPVESRDMPKAVPNVVMRPQLVQFNRCKNVLVEGIEIRDSPFWTLHLYQSEDVTVRGIHMFAYGFNNDGVDIEMTRNVLIENCDISAGDDGFVLKAGRNRDAWRVNRPTENVEIRNCHIRNAVSLVAAGSELSGGIRNVNVHDCTVDTVADMTFFKTNYRRGGFIDNIRISNVRVKSCVNLIALSTKVLYQWSIFPDYERRLTKISNLTIENVTCEGARVGLDVVGDAELPVDGLTVRNVRIKTLSGMLSHVENVINFQSENFTAEKRGAVENPWNDSIPLMPKPIVKGAEKPVFESSWRGKKVAFLGDSITDPRHIGCTKNYWNFLPNLLGIDAHVYGVSGYQMDGMLNLAKKVMRDFHWYIDAIFVMAGTNDFNSDVPRGEWYDIVREKVNRDGVEVELPRRTFSFDEKTFRGRINRLMDYLKRNFPDQQIVLMTALHRGYAKFSETNVQPDESYPNALGLYIDDYNDDIRAAGRIWSAPVMDVYAESGILPWMDTHTRYLHDIDTDRLHPNATGHERLAWYMAHWMLSVPSQFRRSDALFE